MKVVTVACERWLLTRVSKYSDITFGILKNWSLRKGGPLHAVVATGGSTVITYTSHIWGFLISVQLYWFRLPLCVETLLIEFCLSAHKRHIGELLPFIWATIISNVKFCGYVFANSYRHVWPRPLTTCSGAYSHEVQLWVLTFFTLHFSYTSDLTGRLLVQYGVMIKLKTDLSWLECFKLVWSEISFLASS